MQSHQVCFARIGCITNPTPARRVTPPWNVYMAKFDPGWEGNRVGRGLQTDATTPNNVRTCSASWKWYNPQDFVNLKQTMCNTRTWPQQCWKSCANGSNIVSLRFGNHGTKEMSGVKRLTGFKICATTCNSVCKRREHVINNVGRLGVVGQPCSVRLHGALNS